MAKKSLLRPPLGRAEFRAGDSLLLRSGRRSTAGARYISSQLSNDVRRCLIHSPSLRRTPSIEEVREEEVGGGWFAAYIYRDR